MIDRADRRWHRLHPLSPLVSAGRVLIGLLILLAPALVTGRSTWDSFVELVVVPVLALLGVVSWLVTRWRVEDDDLRIETGLFRRNSLRFPLKQLQAIDVVRPGLARLFGLSELRLRMAGSTRGHARLAYLRRREADRLRARLLALAQGAAVAEPARLDEERVLLTIPTPRLVVSILLSSTGLGVGVFVGALVAASLWPGAASAALRGGGFVYAIGIATAIWRRFNGEYRLTVAEAEDGLRLRSGLVATSEETIRPGRVQAVRMIEPLLWRPFGWCRLELDVAGKQRAKGEGTAERRRLRAALPVGGVDLAQMLLERILPEAPTDRRPPPKRARLKSPLRYHYLSWARNDACVVTTSGRLARATDWIPLAKLQSLRRVEGPIQRRLRLVTIHLDTAGRNVHAAVRDRDAAEGDAALCELIELARTAREASEGLRPLPG
ncbi:MAG: PH domain-containing protein [Gaiellaceae bacterium]